MTGQESDVQALSYPWRVDSLPNCGRVLIATRDIAPFELVLADTALVMAPNDLPVCLGCLGQLTASWVPCPLCKWPLCRSECQTSPHHLQECQLFSRHGVAPNIDNTHTSHWMYTAVALLRVLLLKRDDQTKWGTVLELMDHWEERSQDTEVVKAMKIMFTFFTKKLDMSWISLTDVQHVFGVLQTNSVSLISLGGRTFYPTVSLLSHSCLPNLEPTSNPSDKIFLRAKSRIRAGEQLTMRYTHYLSPAWERRREIRAEWMFDCDCPRCTDHTELQTFTSFLKCLKCEGFYNNKSDGSFNFTCSQCKHSQDFTEKFQRFGEIEEKLSSESLSREEIKNLCDEIDGDDHIHEKFYIKVKLYMKFSETFSDSSDPVILEDVASKLKIVLNLIRDIDHGCSKLTGKYLLVLAEVQGKLLTLRKKEEPGMEAGQVRRAVADIVKSKMVANKMLSQYYTLPSS